MNENEKNVNENPDEKVKNEVSEVNEQTTQTEQSANEQTAQTEQNANEQTTQAEQKKNEQTVGENKNEKPKNKKILAFSLVGGIAVIALIIIAIVIACFAGKPSKSKAEDVIKDYLSAINDRSEDEFAKVIDTKGYIVYKEEGEKKFDKKYNDKKYIKNYLEDNNFDELSDVEKSITKALKGKYYSSREYSLKEITSIKKSDKSKKIKVIKAKLKVKYSSSSSSSTVNLKLYVIKVDGEYKVINAEID